MKNFIFITLVILCFGVNYSVGQVIDSHSVKYEEDWEEDGDAAQDLDDIILKVTPNPAGQEAEVVFRNLPGDGTATMRLLDLTGKVYQDVKIGNAANRSGAVKLAIQGLSAGLYIVHLTTAWGDVARRVLVK